MENNANTAGATSQAAQDQTNPAGDDQEKKDDAQTTEVCDQPQYDPWQIISQVVKDNSVETTSVMKAGNGLLVRMTHMHDNVESDDTSVVEAITHVPGVIVTEEEGKKVISNK